MKIHSLHKIQKKVTSILIFCTFYLTACSKQDPAYYEIVGMSLINCENTGQIPFEAISDSVPKKAYALKMELSSEIRKKAQGDVQENGFINEDQLTFMNIYSLTDFDEFHPAGTSLNSYFLTKLNSFSTIDAFVSRGNIGGGKTNGGNYLDNWLTEQYLFLMSPPTLSSEQTFVVKIDFSDGRSLSDTIYVKLY